MNIWYDEPSKPDYQSWIALSALVLILLGAKIMLVQSFGSAVPYWDQWDAEADLLYRLYLESRLNWDFLITPHNEHRILLTRLLSIGLFELNGGWNPILQMFVNAILHVGAIVLLALAVRPILNRGQIVPLVIFMAFLFVLPIGWENSLAGFQSQFYILLIFSILALIGFAQATAFGLRWCLSVACAVAAFFSMASGALVAVASLAVIGLQIITGVRYGKKEYVAAIILLALAAAMVIHVPSIPGHDGLKAHNLRQLLNAFLICLDFPRKNPVFGIWVNLPIAAYACYVLFSFPSRTSPHWVVFSLIIWWFSQALSLSYGRAVAPDSSRYLDIIVFALPINFAILLFALRHFDRKYQRAVFSATCIWLVIVLTGLVFNTVSKSFPAVVERAAQGQQQQGNVVAYLQSGNIAALDNKPLLAIPYPSPQRLAMLLSDPVVKSLLPEPIRPKDIPQATLLDRTALKGRFHSIVAAFQSLMIHAAPSLIGIGLALIILAGLVCKTGDVRSDLE